MRRFALYCDESGISGDSAHYGFGALVMKYQRRGNFAQEFRELSEGREWGEVKWTKTTKGSLRYHKRIVDYFFRTSFLAFHCIVVRRAWVDVHRYHGGSFDLARRKHFTQFLANKIKRLRQRHREHEFRVYVDPIPSSYKKADEAVKVIASRIVASQVDEDAPPMAVGARDAMIENLYTVDSKARPEIQMCDLLLGAVVGTWNDTSTASHKAELKEYIARYLGWPDLRAGTFQHERKFNIWFLTDEFRGGSGGSCPPCEPGISASAWPKETAHRGILTADLRPAPDKEISWLCRAQLSRICEPGRET